MKVVLNGAFITSAIGQIGGTVFQGGPFGTIARINFKPKNRNDNNVFQPCEKEAFTNIAKSWHSLSGAQIILWNAFATPPLSGYNSFLQYNLQYYRLGLGIMLVPPTLPVVPSSIILLSNTIASLPNFNLQANYTASVNPNSIQLFVSINNPLGQTKLVASRLRLVASQPAVAGISGYLFDPSLHGVQVVNGMSQFIGVRLLDNTTGFLSAIQSIQFNS